MSYFLYFLNFVISEFFLNIKQLIVIFLFIFFYIFLLILFVLLHDYGSIYLSNRSNARGKLSSLAFYHKKMKLWTCIYLNIFFLSAFFLYILSDWINNVYLIGTQWHEDVILGRFQLIKMELFIAHFDMYQRLVQLFRYKSWCIFILIDSA